MKRLLKPLLHVMALAAVLQAGEPGGEAARLSAVTLFISGVECPGCAYAVNYAIGQTKGVDEVVSGQRVEDYVLVSFDPGVVSVHQLAQAVWDAPALHGIPYQAALKMVLPEYSLSANAVKVDRLFKSWASWADTELVDGEKGEFLMKFRPLTTREAKGPRGLNLEQIVRAVSAPAPAGLGLKMELVSEKPPM